MKDKEERDADDLDETKALIKEKMAYNYGLAPMRWRNQLEEIRRWPEIGEK